MTRRGAVSGAWSDVLAGLLAALVYSAGQALFGRYPFGPLTRNINDLGTQLVPMHALYRDVLTGRAAGDLLFNWNSALGVPFLPDVGTYLASPLSLLVVLFPRDRVDLALFVIHVLHLALAAGVMAHYLRRFAPGPPLSAAALGAAYATCGWAIDDAGYLPTWLSGLVAFPLLALVGEWTIRRRHPLLGPLLVALVWVANFYTAYMATIGAGLLLLTRLAELRLGWWASLAALARLVRAVGVGIALSAPLLVTVWRATSVAVPAGDAHAPWADLAAVLPADPPAVVARLLPATEGVGSTPGLFVTTPVALLAVAFLWTREVPRTTRLLYGGMLAAVLASLFWVPTHVVWHGFDTPQGSPYRQAFVVAGWLTVLAWSALARGGPGVRAVLGGSAALVLAYWVGSGTEPTSTWTASLFVVGASVAVAVLLLRRFGVVGWPVVGVALVAVVVLEGSVTAAVTTEGHARFGNRLTWNPQFEAVRTHVQRVDEWPVTRTTPGAGPLSDLETWNTANDPMLLGGQGVGYYSSLVPAVTASAVQAVGVTYSGWGRSMIDLADPARDAVLGIGHRVDRGDPENIHVDDGPSAPLVTARELPDSGGNPFRNRNELAAAPAYTIPRVEVLGAEGQPVGARPEGYRGPENLEEPGLVLLATCSTGTRVHLSAPAMAGWVQVGDGEPVEILPLGSRRPGTVMSRGPIDLGPAPGEEVRIAVHGSPVVRLPAEPLGCYDPEALRRGIDALHEAAADVEVGGHGFTARWDGPVDGDALALVPAVAGWRCGTGAGDGLRPPGSAAGFIAFPMDGASELTCRYRPPGLRLGLAVATVAILALVAPLALGRGGWWRGASSRTSAAARSRGT